MDAKLQHTFFRYDRLSRLTGKAYRDDGTRPPDEDPQWVVTYQYDQGSLGMGQRTGMSDPSGSAAWTYGERGRVRSETKTIGGPGAGTFATASTYGPRDEVRTQTYPGGNAGQAGETVTLGYSKWGTPSTLAGSSPYVVQTVLTADGRPDLLKLGGTAASPVLQLDYVYYPWTTPAGRGRLKEIRGDAVANPAVLLRLSYAYDNVGNVVSIQDSLAITPTLNFTYDALDRLTWVAGAYEDRYSYDPIGNLTGHGDVAAYTYNPPQQPRPHAVRSVWGTGEGVTRTVTISAKGVAGGGSDPQMSLRVNGSVRATWTVTSSAYSAYAADTRLTGRDVLEVWFTNGGDGRELWVDAVTVGTVPPATPPPLAYHLKLPGVQHTPLGVQGMSMAPGGLILEGEPEGEPVTVAPDGGAMVYGRGATADEAFSAANAVPGRKQLDATGALRFAVGPDAYAAEYDANGNMTLRVVDGAAYLLTWDRENRLQGWGQGGTRASYVYDGDGNLVRGAITGTLGVSTTAYVGGCYEWRDGASPRSYYYFEGRRVAMREGGLTTWLLGDHLGSTSVTYREDGQSVTQRYYAWGTVRPGPDNALPTDYTFTGQRLDQPSGLMYYGARWYDPLVGRWVQPDTIVPEPGNPQTLNRYTYCGNNPLRFVDPSGHVFKYDDGDTRTRGVPSFSELHNYYFVPRCKLAVDVAHFGAARNQTRKILAQMDRGGEVNVSTRVRGGLGYGTKYGVASGTSGDQRISVARGLFQDWSTRFETWQGKGAISTLLGSQEWLMASSFANEDLPSDYLGFFAEVSGTDLPQILHELGGYQVIPDPSFLAKPRHIGPLHRGDMGAKNYEFTPRIRDGQDWHNVPWPSTLELPQAAAPGSGTWQYRSDYSLWPWQ